MNVSSILALSVEINSAYNSFCKELLKTFNISQTSFDILMFLRNHPESPTAKEISVYKNIKPNVVSLHVDEMVKDGYLKRESFPDDRRKVKLLCTEKASPITESGRKVQKQFFKELLDGLSETDVKNFKYCFEVISENAEEMRKKKGEARG